jgi:hypothetical protein
LSRLRAAALALWDFVVGDDWRTALGVPLALGVTAIFARLGIVAWWVMAIAVPLLLWRSLRRATRGG